MDVITKTNKCPFESTSTIGEINTRSSQLSLTEGPLFFETDSIVCPRLL